MIRNFLLMFLIAAVIMTMSCRDECDGIVCFNGGICSDGFCDCPIEFEGNRCQFERPPDRMRVRGVTVLGFPETDPYGSFWDVLDGPDIYFEVYRGNTLIYCEPTFYEDASSVYTYQFNVDFDFERPQDRYAIYLVDYDEQDADDDMGGVEFTPYQEGQRFPRFVLVGVDDLAFELDVDYEFF